jgi:hypothetical protein
MKHVLIKYTYISFYFGTCNTTTLKWVFIHWAEAYVYYFSPVWVSITEQWLGACEFNLSCRPKRMVHLSLKIQFI